MRARFLEISGVAAALTIVVVLLQMTITSAQAPASGVLVAADGRSVEPVAERLGVSRICRASAVASSRSLFAEGRGPDPATIAVLAPAETESRRRMATRCDS